MNPREDELSPSVILMMTPFKPGPAPGIDDLSQSPRASNVRRASECIYFFFIFCFYFRKRGSITRIWPRAEKKAAAGPGSNYRIHTNSHIAILNDISGSTPSDLPTLQKLGEMNRSENGQ